MLEVSLGKEEFGACIILRDASRAREITSYAEYRHESPLVATLVLIMGATQDRVTSKSSPRYMTCIKT